MIELVFLACILIALVFAMLSTYKKLIFYTLRSLYSYFLPVLSHLIIPFTISLKNDEILLKYFLVERLSGSGRHLRLLARFMVKICQFLFYGEINFFLRSALLSEFDVRFVRPHFDDRSILPNFIKNLSDLLVLL